MQNQQPQQLPLRADDATLKGVYANVMQVTHTREEFIMDFFLAHQPSGQLTARIITSPGHLKRIIAALQENVKRYEAQFGSIEPAEEQKNFGFGA